MNIYLDIEMYVSGQLKNTEIVFWQSGATFFLVYRVIVDGKGSGRVQERLAFARKVASLLDKAVKF